MVFGKDWCRGMASMRKNLPIGVEFFDELIHQNYYYVDKTMMIGITGGNLYGNIKTRKCHRFFYVQLAISRVQC